MWECVHADTLHGMLAKKLEGNDDILQCYYVARFPQ